MEKLRRGTIKFNKPPVIASHGCIVSQKEAEGPIGMLFDRVEPDEYFGQDNWEKAERERLQNRTIKNSLNFIITYKFSR